MHRRGYHRRVFRASRRLRPVPRGSSSLGQGFWEYLPPSYGEDEPAPLLVFLHGLGENGDGGADLERVLRHGPPRLIAEDRWPPGMPFVVLAPQHPGPRCHDPARIDALVEHAIEAYEVDPARVYLAGLSCGAIAAWRYLALYPANLVAAAVLVCGDGRAAWADAGEDFAHVPIWAFHGDEDDIVPPRGSTVPIAGLQRLRPDVDHLLTLYAGVGHDSWTQTFDGSAGHDVYGWLLDQKRH